MVLPFIKVFSLVVRVFSKPLIAFTKQMHIKKNGYTHPYARARFIQLGNYIHEMETKINRRFMNIETQFAYKPLNDDLALEKGIESFY